MTGSFPWASRIRKRAVIDTMEAPSSISMKLR
jgi:hypothetical protein